MKRQSDFSCIILFSYTLILAMNQYEKELVMKDPSGPGNWVSVGLPTWAQKRLCRTKETLTLKAAV